jgi:hypothetical protein
MKKVISMFAILVMIAGLCEGCKKDADTPEPEATQQSQESNAKDWEPETSEQPTDNSPKDDHDQSAGDHSGHNH